MAVDDIKAAQSDSDDKRLSSMANSEIEPAEEISDGAVDEAREKAAGEKSPAAVEVEAEREEPKDYIKGFKLIAVMAVITIAAFLMLLDMSIVATAVPRITTEFHSLQDVGWYGAAYNLASAAVQPLTGKFYSYFKTKWVFLSFFGIFLLGSLLCGVAVSSTMLIIGRAVAGLGTSGIQNGAMTIIAIALPLEKRPTYTGILIGTAQLGILFGPLIGGALTEYTTWRWCFYINLPLGAVVVLFLLFLSIPEHTTSPRNGSALNTIRTKFDIPGFLIFAPAAIQMLLGLQYGGVNYPWNSATVIGLLCGSVATFAVFFIWEGRRGDDAMIPLSMLTKLQVWTSCLVGGFLIAMTFCASFYLPIYFQSVKGVNPWTSGVYVLPSILSTLIFTVSSGILMGKVGYYIPFAVVGLAIATVGNGLTSTFAPNTSTGRWIGYQIIMGSGRGMTMQVPIIAVQSVLLPAQIPVAMAILVFFQTFSGAVFLTIAQTIFTNILRARLGLYAPSVNPDRVIAAGATGIGEVVPPADIPGVLHAYSDGVNNVFYLAVAAGAAGFIASWGMGWIDIRKKKQPTTGDV